MLRLLCVTGGILLIAGGISAPNAHVAYGDAPLAVHQPAAATGLQAAIETGLRYEDRLHWGDAIQHYETALREFTADPTLQQRLLISKLHYDVVRRYHDASFQQTVRQTSISEALDLYTEILANIETHYVDGVDWKKLVRHGSASLEVALTEDAFLNPLLANASPEAIGQFRQSVHTHVVHRDVKSRYDLRSVAATVATLANEQIGLSPTAVVLEFACGSLSALDTYSRFLTAGQLDETFSSIEGNLVGLGVELKADADRLRILSVIADGPAARAGLVAGDLITAVAGKSTSEISPDAAADLLRGSEGSYVAVRIDRADGSSQDLQIQRQKVNVPCVENVHLVDPQSGIGYLRLTNFQKTTTREIEKALWELHRAGMKALVIDVRGNPGGLLTAAVEVADRFLPTGRIVSTRGRNARENFDYAANRSNTWNLPLAVLIDSNSASASEIFAGAILDNNRGRLVGQRSYGKGSVQGIFQMQSAKCGLCLTTAKFYSPSGHGISDRGVQPDVHVDLSEPAYITARPNAQGQITRDADDAVLQRAIQTIRSDVRLSSLVK